MAVVRPKTPRIDDHRVFHAGMQAGTNPVNIVQVAERKDSLQVDAGERRTNRRGTGARISLSYRCW